MPEIIRSRNADIDVLEIWTYIGEDNLKAADTLVEEINKKLQMLLDYPMSGRLRNEFGHGVRSVPIGQYVLYYLPHGDDIELIRVLHSSRKMKKSFF